MPETYVSIDIETDGPCPGLNSMLSLGAVAIDDKGNELTTWTANFYPLPEAVPNKDTMDWWNTQSEAWEIVNQDKKLASIEMESFAVWLESLPTKPIAVAWPASFDFAFVCWYLWRFTGRCPLGFACLDIRSLAMGMTGSKGYYKMKEAKLKKLVPHLTKEYYQSIGLKEHVALDDAREQGMLFSGLLNILQNQ